MGKKSQVQLIADATAIQSLRDSDFDAYSAYGEVIDNSIQAGAKNIQIQFDTSIPANKKKYLKIDQMVFIDDGSGMPANIIHKCLQLGYSSRFNDRTGIGRFGVGMTLGAINQCKRVEVYSREKKNGDWLYTYIDLDEISANRDSNADIPEPIKKTPPKMREFAPENAKGTVVVWSKYDRQATSASEIQDEVCTWMGRTFRYFIWDGLKITVNGKSVEAVDPLYIRNPLGTPAAFEFEHMSIDWQVPKDRDDVPKDCPDTSKITIRTSLLDKSLRKNQGAGNSNEAKNFHIHMNEGISILRNKREVFYDHIPHWKPALKDIDRWWGCEIHFDPILDREFTVKNIKRGAVPAKELKDELMKLINPTRNTAVEKVQDDWRKIKSSEDEENKKRRGIETEHDDSEKIANDTKDPLKQKPVDKKIAKEVAKKHFQDKDVQEKYERIFADQPFTIVDRAWKGDMFWEVEHMGGNAAIVYNTEHPFFTHLSLLRKRVENGDASTDLSKDLLTTLDLLFIAFAKGEFNFRTDEESEEKFSPKEILDMQRQFWGQYLKKYMTTLKNKKA